jgi:hypothetical protein
MAIIERGSNLPLSDRPNLVSAWSNSRTCSWEKQSPSLQRRNSTMATMTANASPLTAEAPAGDAAVAALLADLDMTIVEAGPATASRKCSTDNGATPSPGANADTTLRGGWATARLRPTSND